MILSDVHLRTFIDNGGIEPPDHSMIGPASIDLTLSDEFVTFDPANLPRYIDPWADNSKLGEHITVPSDWQMQLDPGQFALARTAEIVNMGTNLCGRVEGKSSLGRLGQIVHVTAGFIDPGFRGHITLELYNCFPVPFVFVPGMPICQLSVMRLTSIADKHYTGKYGGEGLQQSRYHLNYDKWLEESTKALNNHKIIWNDG